MKDGLNKMAKNMKDQKDKEKGKSSKTKSTKPKKESKSSDDKKDEKKKDENKDVQSHAETYSTSEVETSKAQKKPEPPKNGCDPFKALESFDN